MPRAEPALSLASLRATATPTPKKRQGPSQGLDHVARVAVAALRIDKSLFRVAREIKIARALCGERAGRFARPLYRDGPLPSSSNRSHIVL